MADAHKLPALIAVTMAAFLAPGQSPAAHATPVPACSNAQLQSVAYGAGVATGTDYLAIAITNTGKRSCRVGNTITLLHTSGLHRTRLASGTTNPIFGTIINVLAPRQRAVAQIMTTWAAEQPGDPDCPDGKPHPVDRVNAIELETGTVTTVTNPFDIERCLRRVAPLTTDAWLVQCEHDKPTVCEPISPTTHRPKTG